MYFFAKFISCNLPHAEQSVVCFQNVTFFIAYRGKRIFIWFYFRPHMCPQFCDAPLNTFFTKATHPKFTRRFLLALVGSSLFFPAILVTSTSAFTRDSNFLPSWNTRTPVQVLPFLFRITPLYWHPLLLQQYLSPVCFISCFWNFRALYKRPVFLY